MRLLDKYKPAGVIAKFLQTPVKRLHPNTDKMRNG
jgi:hypothetical protein